LEQRDLGNYKTDLQQISRAGRHVGVDVQKQYWFRDRSTSVAIWQPILGALSAEIGDTPSSDDWHSTTDGRMRKEWVH